MGWITMEVEYSHPELEECSDGALRVARRKALYSLQNAKEIYGRLDLEENADYSEQNSVGNLQGSIGASSDELAKNIKRELESRNAEYKSRSEVMR